MVSLTLLGPQRRVSGARAAVAERIPDGPVAAVAAGWLEREADTVELDDVLGGRLVELGLHRRWQALREEEAAFDENQQWLSDTLAELRTAYRVRLQQALAAVLAVSRQVREERVRAEAVADGIAAIQALDAWNLRCGLEIREQAAARVAAASAESLSRHREEVRRLLDGSAGLVVTGGHVAILLHLVQLFGVADWLRESPARLPVVAWSAGAMALGERVVLFHDRPPYGERPPEVYAEGVGAYAGVVPFPHARRRLRLDDHDRVGLLARRLAPRQCVVLDDGARLDLFPGAPLPGAARRLAPSGQVVSGPDAAGAEGEPTW